MSELVHQRDPQEIASDMNYQTRLHKRGPTYYIRVKIPAGLRRFYDGKQEIKFSLRTKDPREAAILARQHSVAIDQEFEARRHASGGIATPGERKRLVLDPATIQSLCGQWRHLCLDGDECSRREGLSEADYQESHALRQGTQDVLRELLARGQTDRIYPALKIFLDLMGFDIPPSGEGYQRLAYSFLQAATETNEDQLRRDAGDVVRTPDPTNLPFTTQVASSYDQPTLNDFLAEWETDVPNRPAETISAFQTAVREFNELTGAKPAGQLVRKDFLKYRDHLKDIVKLKPKTIQKKLNFLGAVLQVAVDNERISTNPCSRVTVKNGKTPHKHRLPYSPDDMNRIYQSPLYTQARRRPLGGGGEAAVWLPVLGPLTGARLEEIAQLRPMDVKCEADIWYLDIVEDDGNQTTHLKTRSSRRRVPIHPFLVEMGFLRYVEHVKRAKYDRLFPELRVDCKGKMSGNWTKWWGRYARSSVIGIESDQKVFHSFRHGFRDCCREAEIDEELAEALSGRSSRNVGRGYGSGFSLARLYDAITKIEYPDVKFPGCLFRGD